MKCYLYGIIIHVKCTVIAHLRLEFNALFILTLVENKQFVFC